MPLYCGTGWTKQLCNHTECNFINSCGCNLQRQTHTQWVIKSWRGTSLCSVQWCYCHRSHQWRPHGWEVAHPAGSSCRILQCQLLRLSSVCAELISLHKGKTNTVKQIYGLFRHLCCYTKRGKSSLWHFNAPAGCMPAELLYVIDRHCKSKTCFRTVCVCGGAP